MDRTLFPLSQSQKEMLEFDVGNYNPNRLNQLALRINFKEKVASSMVEKALNILLQDQQALRLRLKKQGNEYLQYVAPYEWVSLPACHFSSEEEAQEEFEKLMKRDQAILEVPLVRFILFFVGGKSVLYMQCHHILMDGFSIYLWMQWLDEAITSLREGKEPPRHCGNYLAYVEHQLAMQNSKKYVEDEAYWMQTLRDVKNPLSVGEAFPDEKDLSAERITYQFTGKETQRIAAFGQANRFSHSVIFMAAFLLALYHRHPAEQLTIGQMILNRRTATEHTCLGDFSAELLVSVKPNRNASVLSFVEQVRMAEWEAFRHCLLQHDQILRNVQMHRPEIKALRNVEFNYLPMQCEMTQIEGFENLYNDSLDTDVAFDVWEQAQGLLLILDYKKAALTKAEAETLLQEIIHQLTRMQDEKSMFEEESHV